MGGMGQVRAGPEGLLGCRSWRARFGWNRQFLVCGTVPEGGREVLRAAARSDAWAIVVHNVGTATARVNMSVH